MGPGRIFSRWGQWPFNPPLHIVTWSPKIFFLIYLKPEYLGHPESHVIFWNNRIFFSDILYTVLALCMFCTLFYAVSTLPLPYRDEQGYRKIFKKYKCIYFIKFYMDSICSEMTFGVFSQEVIKLILFCCKLIEIL